MRLKDVLVVLGLAGLASPAAAVNVSWTDWQSQNGASVAGQISTSSSTVNVSYSNSANSIVFAQLAGGADYWQNGGSGRDPLTSPYTSIGPNGNSNIPTGTDIIALGAQATHTLVFDQAISDIYLSFVSINGNSFVFGTPIQLLSAASQNIDGAGTDSSGYWGSGATDVTSSGGSYSLNGNGEGHGTILIPGVFTSISFATTYSESWHGFTIGVQGTAPVTPPVPAPAAGWLLVGGLAGLGAVRRAARNAGARCH